MFFLPKELSQVFKAERSSLMISTTKANFSFPVKLPEVSLAMTLLFFFFLLDCD